MIASAPLSPFASAATKYSTTYEVERAWFDAAHLYVLYREETAEVRYSLADVHGSILSHKSALWIASYLRSELNDGGVLKLNKGESAESVVYRDADFAITISGSQITLSGRQIDGSVPICPNQEATGWPMTWRESIFYCATLYSSSGNVAWTVPEPVLQSMKAGLQSTALSVLTTLGGAAKEAFCLEDKVKLVAAAASGSSLKTGTWSVGANDISWTSAAVGPPGSTASVANGVVAYSPNLIVLKVKRDAELYWAQCRKGKCARIGNIGANNSYLLLDDQVGQAIAISIPDLTKPRLFVQLGTLR